MSRLIDELVAQTRRLCGELIFPITRRLRKARQPTKLQREVGTTSAGETHRTTAPTAPPSVGRLVRDGKLVRLRAHVVANRPAFQRWYADEEIARLLRHDQRPLNAIQSRSYFDTIIMPLSARGMCFAIHEAATDRLIGTTALTDIEGADFRSALFRIVIGEKDAWGHGYGTEATRLVVEEAFGPLRLDRVRLEVFRHNARALATYRRVGFRQTGEHVEFVGKERWELHVVEMALDRSDYLLLAQPARASQTDGSAEPSGFTPVAAGDESTRES